MGLDFLKQHDKKTTMFLKGLKKTLWKWWFDCMNLPKKWQDTGLILEPNDTGSRWWFQITLIFTPHLGKIPILTNILKMG